MPTVSLPLAPPESAAVAVMVCTPALSTALKLPPVPICSSMSEVQTRLAVRSPSSASLAVPVKPIVAPEAKVAR
jgi:hypothetical protein